MSHAKLSPSGFKTWALCPGSPAAQAPFPNTSSVYADEGTAAHWVLEQVVRQRYEGDNRTTALAAHYVGKEVNVADEAEEPRFVTVDGEMAEHVQSVVDYVEERRAMLEDFVGPVEIYAERPVSPSCAFGDTDSDGTADVTIVSADGVEVVDLKYGRGVMVDLTYVPGSAFIPEQCPDDGQLLVYLVGAMCGRGRSSNGRYTVAQPRKEHPLGPIRSIDVSEADIQGFIEATKQARAATRQPNAPRIPGSHQCKWCRAKATCREAADAASVALPASAPIYSAQDMFPDPDKLSPEQLVRVLYNADFIRAFLDACEEYAKDALFRSAAPPPLAAAYKLVQGGSHRRWAHASEESTADAIKRIRWMNPLTEKTEGLKKRDMYEEKLRSPAQLEAHLKRLFKQGLIQATHMEAFQRLITKPQGALVLAPISDSRPAAKPSNADEMFAGVK